MRSAVRTYVRKAREGMQAKDGEGAAAAVAEAAKMLDQAASKGVIHKNQAARRKSRLMSHLAAMERPSATEAPAPKAPARRRAAGTTGTTRTTARRTTTSTRTRAAKPAEPS